jgi:glucose-6-phosphate isomerase
LAEPERCMTPQEAWKQFDDHARQYADATIAAQFVTDPGRLERMSVEAAGLYLDLSKQSWTAEAFAACLDLARATGVEAHRDALFAGKAVNATEGRAALHPALRAAPVEAFQALGQPVSHEILAGRQAMADLARAVRSGSAVGATGRAFTAIVHIGIGGSDLGPRLVWEALKPLDPAFDMRFVANIDPNDMAEALVGLDPETTLVIVVSKSFTTQETMANAGWARDWLAKALPADGLARHLIGVTAAPERARDFGCGQTLVFGDWVGGRFSLWSTAGLSCVIGLGPEVFDALLGGARAMDHHFLSAPLRANAPVLMALAQVWNIDGLGRRARTVAPYANRLRRLPAFLQQLEMESNGKGVRLDGSPVTRGTCPVVFGEPGANGQHAFFQQMHQGPEAIPADIIMVATGEDGPLAPLWSNALAQAEALMLGRTREQAEAALVQTGMDAGAAAILAPHKTFPGNRPSTSIVMPALTPAALGALIALYEHKVFVEGVIWGINSFDQWGVELGKALARTLLDEAQSGVGGDHDPSTLALLQRLSGA